MTLQTALTQVLEENAKQKEEISSLRQSLTYVEEQLAWFKRQIFGPRSEKTIKNVDQPKLFEEGFGLTPNPRAF